MTIRKMPFIQSALNPGLNDTPQGEWIALEYEIDYHIRSGFDRAAAVAKHRTPQAENNLTQAVSGEADGHYRGLRGLAEYVAPTAFPPVPHRRAPD